MRRILLKRARDKYRQKRTAERYWAHRLGLWIDTCTPSDEPIAVELYDHPRDPQETVNLAGVGQHAELVRRLSGQLQALRSKSPTNSNDQTGDRRPISSRNTIVANRRFLRTDEGVRTCAHGDNFAPFVLLPQGPNQ